MLGPEALSADNAEATLASLDRLAALPCQPSQPKPSTSTSYQKESSYDSDLSSLNMIMDDTRRMQNRPYSTYHSVQEAAKGVLFDLDDSCSQGNMTLPISSLPVPIHSIKDLPEGEGLPKRLVVTVQLPMLNTASEANVDVDAQSLKILAPGKCSLSLTLPSLVKEASITAKWNKTRKDLTITLIKQ